eukprot:5119384-Pyramimonas_sp.AAC.2
MKGPSAKGIEQLGNKDLAWLPEQGRLGLAQFFNRSRRRSLGHGSSQWSWRHSRGNHLATTRPSGTVSLTRGPDALLWRDGGPIYDSRRAQAGMMWDIEGSCDA